MGLGGGKGAVTPGEENPSPRLQRGPKSGKRKMKKKKVDMEDLKKEASMVRKPKMDADQIAF